MEPIKKNWYVVYTKPRWEKKVYSLLVDRGIEAYCPMTRTRRQWSDRVKWSEEPLFKSYVFVKVGEDGQTLVRMVRGVVNFVYWLGRPAIVRDREVEDIRKFLNEYEEVWAEPVSLQAEERVRILTGAFMGKEGRVVKVVNNKVRLLIESIGYSLVAVFDKSNVGLIENIR